MTHRNYLRLLMALIAGTTLVSAAPLGTAFTYQGRLFDQNTLANGSYDLRVGLYDAASAGTRIGPLLTLPAVAVSNGVFTVTLDFGASAFGPGGWSWGCVRAAAPPPSPCSPAGNH